MPNLDGTGPQGKGPKTGRGLGNCNSVNESQNSNQDQTNQDNGGLRKRRGQGLGQRGGNGLGRQNKNNGLGLGRE